MTGAAKRGRLPFELKILGLLFLPFNILMYWLMRLSLRCSIWRSRRTMLAATRRAIRDDRPPDFWSEQPAEEPFRERLMALACNAGAGDLSDRFLVEVFLSLEVGRIYAHPLDHDAASRLQWIARVPHPALFRRTLAHLRDDFAWLADAATFGKPEIREHWLRQHAGLSALIDALPRPEV